ncbi:DUF6096 family protein [Paenibacillus apiarius]|uniref:DUF6096 family protein n=1 Tax=Paenibacillus apiarius TaxID=46240 RepID=A0ABT4DQT5_9BACL|nr:DUF6096 family protein [Paenibacillus apiarius]MCY9513317.1 DUF6096 family protein [Paenibacillus apiarius]MCY9519711.1 DUF6096 family protein [Paenibacillus apiarius]MCY9553233.1 DUF6096 family protein [Paenibacillus apiarius]MCY9557083.1 DUF6096 family protein [Paenibacillus apiarius]MCY9682176.1 DUF6096 family protein [Paenibacillus apiarius]
MLYTTLQVGEKEYKLRLPSKSACAIERKIGKSVLTIFGEGELNDLPNLETLITVLHGSLQVYEHGVTLDDTYEIYDKYVEHGGSYAGLIQELVEVLKVSGFFKGAPKSKTE